MDKSYFVGKSYKNILDLDVLNQIDWRAGDLVISGPPRSGTNWVQHIVHQLISNGDTNFISIKEVVPVFGVTPVKMTSQEKLNIFAAKRSPRALKTHFGPPVLPVHPHVRYLVVMRSVFDIPMSLIKFMNSFSEQHRTKYKIPYYSSMSELMADYEDMQFYFDFINEWWPHRNKPQVLFLHYNDLVQDLRGQIEKINAFIDVPTRTGSDLERIFDHCGFRWMKENQNKFELEADGSVFIQSGSMIREGQSSKAALSPSEQERLRGKLMTELRPDVRAWVESGGVLPP